MEGYRVMPFLCGVKVYFMSESAGVQEKKTTITDKFLWFVALILMCLAIWGNYQFSLPGHEISSIFRISGVVVLVLLALICVCFTQKGKSFLGFAKESRAELRKIVWPTRKEAMQTTLVVAVITGIMSLVLWGMDSIIFKLVSLITRLGH